MATEDKYALIGAGPGGLATARNLQKHAIAFDGFEAWTDLGGRTNPAHPNTTTYRGSHSIVSREVLQFTDYPMPDDYPDYPGHQLLLEYLNDFADHFSLRDNFHFGARVVRAEPDAGAWRLVVEYLNGQVETRVYRGLIIATGRQGELNWPSLNGEFGGRLIHVNAYRDGREFADQRVLVIGGANRGCEVATDLVAHAASVDLSMRRGYYLVPPYLFGRPTDTLVARRAMLAGLRRPVSSRVVKWFGGELQRFGLPRPDYAFHEMPPVINGQLLQQLGQGALKIRADVGSVSGSRVEFVDGVSADYDAIICATGTRVAYPFIDRQWLNWQGAAPQLYLNMFSPANDRMAVIGMVSGEAMGWQVKYEQAELVARLIRAERATPEYLATLHARLLGNWPDVSGGYRFVPQPRLAIHVNTQAYRSALASHIAELNVG